jgi:hypothetical protein
MKRYLIVILGLWLLAGVSLAEPVNLAEISWGSAENQVGLINMPEVERVGPTSFCLDEAGNIYITDYVNKAVKMFSPDGEFIAVVANDVAGNHVAVGQKGNIYVRCDGGIVKYFSKGTAKGSLKAPAGISLIEGYEQSVSVTTGTTRNPGNDLIFINDIKHDVFLIGSEIGTRDEAKLRSMDKVEKFNGHPALDNNLYQPKWINKNQGIINIADSGTREASKPIKVTTDDRLGGIIFKGLDIDRNVIIENERITADGYAHLELRLYTSYGLLLDTVELPNLYFTAVYRKTYTAPDGSVYQMLTSPTGVKFIKWQLSQGE